MRAEDRFSIPNRLGWTEQARRGLKPVAVAVLLMGGGSLVGGWAQTRPEASRGTPQDGRNLLVQTAAPTGVASNQRLALVIGNSEYRDAPLVNPVNDARAIAATLKELGFTVVLRENADQRAIQVALREFGDRLRAGGTGLFYYAGHGMQIKGRNYLIPVGSSIEREDEVAYGAVDAQAVLDKMEAAGNAANIMILDACRNNPFTRSTRSGQAGLAQMDAPVGTLVAYATSPGAVASDGTGTNGLYTQHLLQAMRQPNSKVEDVFKQVRANVRRDSAGKQIPWESTSLEGDFYFRGGPPDPKAAERAAAEAAAKAAELAAAQQAAQRAAQEQIRQANELALENALWDAVKTSDLPVELRAYLNRYPKGRYASEARSRLDKLQLLEAAASRPNVAAVAPSAAPVVAAPGRPAPVVTPAAAVQPMPVAAAPALVPPAAVSPPAVRPAPAVTTAAAPQPMPASTPSTDKPSAKPAAVPSPAVASPAPAATSAAAFVAPAAAQQYKFQVGDSWTFASENVLAEKRGEYTQKVTGKNAAGELVINDGSGIASPDGEPRYMRLSDRERFFSASFRLLPSQLREGFKEPVAYDVTTRFTDGRESKFVGKGTLEVQAREKVLTPAGDFMAWRLVRGVRGSVSGGDEFSTQETFWYVPELKRAVALERIETSLKSGKATLHERAQLTAFTLADRAVQSALKTNMEQAARTPGGTRLPDSEVNALQAAVDKRTEELLTEMAKNPSPVAAVKPSSPATGPARPAVQTNSAGFSVGDRWRYQTVDKLKQEVVRNWSRSVDGFDAKGNMNVNDGNFTLNAEGEMLSQQRKDGFLREFSPPMRLFPKTLQAGFSEPIKRTMKWRNPNGSFGYEEQSGSMKVHGLEKVNVPAGEFDAWKIEHNFFYDSVNEQVNTRDRGRIKNVIWYVPALRQFVVQEFERRGPQNQIWDYERNELTSYVVRAGDVLAKR